MPFIPDGPPPRSPAIAEERAPGTEAPPPEPEGAALRRGAGPGRTTLRYLGPLHEVVAVGLHRPSFEALCRGGEPPPRPPLDRAYLRKVLDEEVARQFGHPLRPIVELVLNAADAARGRSATPIVEVTIEDGQVTVGDDGDGMSLATILSRLLLPFATDKVPGVDLGRFGVGFFSVLGFGVADPSSFSLHVETGDGREGWSVRVVATGRSASSLILSLRDIGPRQGTRVKVASALLDPGEVRGYLDDALHFFPRSRAGVRVNGTILNDGAKVAGGVLLEERVETAAGAAPLEARFHVGGRALSAAITAATYHVGVKVEPCFAVPELMLLDFPGAVELTEGRDALKPGPAFSAVAAAFHRRLARLASGASAAGKQRVAELCAQISALMLQSAAWPEVAADLRAHLLGAGCHLVSPDRSEALLGFLGPEAASAMFIPDSFWAEREWQPFLPGERELLEDELWIEPVETLAALGRRRPDLAGLAHLVARAGDAEATLAALCHGRRRRSGPLPCLGTRRAILVRADSPSVEAPRGWADVYALRTAFDRAAGMREPDVERDLIVAAPLASEARKGSP